MSIANGLYQNDGTFRTTTVLGTSYVGLYAGDGSVNIIVDDTTTFGPYHASGALRVNSGTAAVLQDDTGAYYSNHVMGRSV